MTAGALTLSITDVAFFTPPHRSDRPERRTTGDHGILGAVRTLRRELAAAAEAADEPLPRITRSYPY